MPGLPCTGVGGANLIWSDDGFVCLIGDPSGATAIVTAGTAAQLSDSVGPGGVPCQSVPQLQLRSPAKRFRRSSTCLASGRNPLSVLAVGIRSRSTTRSIEPLVCRASSSVYGAAEWHSSPRAWTPASSIPTSNDRRRSNPNTVSVRVIGCVAVNLSEGSELLPRPPEPHSVKNT
jgi:hypothetical protein